MFSLWHSFHTHYVLCSNCICIIWCFVLCVCVCEILPSTESPNTSHHLLIDPYETPIMQMVSFNNSFHIFCYMPFKCFNFTSIVSLALSKSFKDVLAKDSYLQYITYMTLIALIFLFIKLHDSWIFWYACVCLQLLLDLTCIDNNLGN